MEIQWISETSLLTKRSLEAEVLFPMLCRLTVKNILENISKSVLIVVFKETSVFRVRSLVSFRLNQKQLFWVRLTGSTFLDVDSTVGFPSEGELFIVDIDGSSLHLTYTGKTINQFTGVGGLNSIIDDQSEIRLKSASCKAFTGPDNTKKVTVRICSALKRYKGNDNTRFMRKGEKLEIQSIGLESKTIRNQNWFSSILKFFGTSRKLRLSMKLKEHIDSTLMIPTSSKMNSMLSLKM